MRSDAKHTPGPWVVLQVPTSAGSAFRIGVADVVKGCIWIYADGIRKGIDDELPRAQELAANASLVAAAPDLLEALKRCKFDSLNMSLADLEFCRAAYRKATEGTTP